MSPPPDRPDQSRQADDQCHDIEPQACHGALHAVEVTGTDWPLTVRAWLAGCGIVTILPLPKDRPTRIAGGCQ